MQTHTKKAIDEVLATLYANEARGYYSGVDAKILKTEAIRRIQRNLATLDAKARKGLESEANYRLARFGEFTILPRHDRESVISLAKRRHLQIEQAYEANIPKHKTMEKITMPRKFSSRKKK